MRWCSETALPNASRAATWCAATCLLLQEGDRIAADARLLDANDFSVDEALLTGESLPVHKVAATHEAASGLPGGDNTPFVFSGTMVVQGQASAQVTATGAKTQIGRIGKALQTITVERTPLQRQTAEVVRIFALIGLLLCAVVVALYALTRGGFLAGLLAGITLAMAVLPEEFPLVLTVFLALGAWRISSRRVLTRRMPAIETLGSTTVLCVDKTGTLTENRMAVSSVQRQGNCMMRARLRYPTRSSWSRVTLRWRASSIHSIRWSAPSWISRSTWIRKRHACASDSS